jgi:hypothetical protein
LSLAFALTSVGLHVAMPDLRREANDPKAQELATAHEKLAVAIQKHLDDCRSRRNKARRMAVKFARLPRCEAQGAIVREGTQPPLKRFPGVSRGEQDARLHQTLSDALWYLSPLPLGAVSRPA